jgi:hypothetical protein
MAQAPRLRGQHALFYEKVIRRRKPTRSDPNRVTSSHYWCCDWSRGRDPETGKPRRRVFYFATKDEAIAKCREIETTPQPKLPTTVAEKRAARVTASRTRAHVERMLS